MHDASSQQFGLFHGQTFEEIVTFQWHEAALYPKPNDHIYYKQVSWSKANCPLADMYGLLSEKDWTGLEGGGECHMWLWLTNSITGGGYISPPCGQTDTTTENITFLQLYFTSGQ